MASIKKIKEIFSKICHFFKELLRLPKKWPSKKQWRNFLDALNYRERLILTIFLAVFSLSILFFFYFSHLSSTKAVPAQGGTYTEGILGEPRYINPVLSASNDTDRDLMEIVFSGLMKYNEKGEVIPDIAKDYAIGNNGKTYDFALREDVFWHDGKKLTAEDVVFTIKTIQDADFKSPLRISWQGVRVEKLDDFTVRFRLENVYAPFLENTTVGILPKHIWTDITAQNFALSEFNIEPTGSGPYAFQNLDKDKNGKIKEITFEKFDDYYTPGNVTEAPYIENLRFKFFDNEASLFGAFRNGQIDGMNFIFSQRKKDLKSNESAYSITLPRYFAVFFNQNQSQILADKTVRLALSHGTNKQELIEEIFNGEAVPIETPIPPHIFGFTPNTKKYDFAPQHAMNILKAAGWTDKDEDGFREKTIDGEKAILEVNLSTTDWPELTHAASILKDQWKLIGVKVNLSIVKASEIQQNIIRPREYDALLFGEILSINPDPFSFWHSFQKKDPGLNLALYDNNEVDRLLEKNRQTLDDEERKDALAKFQKIVVDEVPAVFLYSPTYIYVVRNKVKGIGITNAATPSGRFSEIEKWYIETKRIKK